MAHNLLHLLLLVIPSLHIFLFLYQLSAVGDTDSDDQVDNTEEVFKAWLDYTRKGVESQPRFEQFFHRSKNTSTVVVDLNGRGNFTSIQAAIDSIPFGNKNPVYIIVNPGIYREKVMIPRMKDFVTLQGQDRGNTVIVWNDTATSATSTFLSASISVDAQYFVAMNITFQNSAPEPTPGAEGEQAVALRISGDNAVFYGCGFIGFQDTLYDQKGEHYFRDCYIEGSIDFVFGNGRSMYEGCELHVVASGGFLTAQKRARETSDSGFVFLNCTISGTDVVYLGRAWGRYSRVVFIYTYMGDIIKPEGWHNWGDPRRNATVYYGQYKCSGPGAGPNGRTPWSHELTDKEAQPFLSLNFIQGYSWIPLVIPTLNF
ncbi:hypothetical protein KP509_37G019200 [Ceratopteris richardii]|uniref:Pectinesterase n=1 Tax=Ceratopteris richardii TaxID=49495 RepID=A0A8T2Q6Z4_CERRI|nr:hypothetical protein KP509_37G019200 [Ceratopteris richardii]